MLTAWGQHSDTARIFPPTCLGFDFGFEGFIYNYWPSFGGKGQFLPQGSGSSAQGGDELGHDPDLLCVEESRMRRLWLDCRQGLPLLCWSEAENDP